MQMIQSEDRIDGRTITAAAILIILFFSLLYSSISLWDPDFWWHINTGKYIVEHGKLPHEDPFTFTPAGKDIRIDASTLKGYWLAQIVLYDVWKMGGVAGVIVVRVMILAFTLFLTWRFMKRGNTYLRLAGILLAGNTLFYFTGERPQLFVLPLAILLFTIIEAYLENRSKAILLLPLVVILWTNLHKSSLFAIAVFIIYIISALASASNALSRKEKALFISLCLISGAMIFASPIGFDKIADIDIFQKNIMLPSTIEFSSPFKLFSSYGILYPSYWICLAIMLVLLLSNIKRIPLHVTLLLIATSLLSLTGTRYMVFFVLAASLLFRLPQIKLNKFVQKTFLLISLVPVVLNIGYFKPFNFTIRETYPFESVSILKEKNLKRIFTHLEWGGFVGYFLPDSKVFIDGKILSEEALAQYETTLWGTEAMGQKEWKNNLERYEVDAVIVPYKDFSTERPVDLIGRLSADSDWQMAYQDGKQELFVRKGPVIR